ncbi:bifunctional folylpolyglutamate synthase/dihydrofolate synthase [Campylobacter sp. VicNov18]|uniref:Mur ligase family protein n=1 Tax=Campylobacter bilis TaxID=2691918 RepID=UPI00130E6412|nr:Mur ligase family protein [Campylobacter bilis]MPV63668.1 bifunctional folylpolyglutamate synthase/dihydrofolate synthase [Campylobacter hepaticus]MBM0637169.1 bifunctional folylpolyglutamate synthase/dihydrofolate synthase [Campylobacter bilis]MCC8277885.1 bifunctional folylpolyglutamate synthase/dihydrofolate synthase [Campylobacter bilis]MCC8298816.1 bifunctional folylpolyglutamate synthase/dihydrofolate synthase [Campylobacter bilis]MCC8300795.1 bifunctional folylpolyglutamate synthase/
MSNMEKIENFLARKTTNYEKIDRFLMFRMYEKYKNHFKHIPIIQLIGTNGKGSTGRFLTQLLENLNYTVGHYTSPHIFSFNERFYLEGKIASDEQLQKSHDKLEGIFQKDLEKLSYFEYATFLAMFLFQDCDFIVLEAGVGGEYDATSVFERKMNIFTKIGLDHTQILGNSLKLIARTKLKVMAPLALISDEQEKIVFDLAQKIALLKKANLELSSLASYLTEDFKIYCMKFSLPYFLRHNLKLALKACELLTSKKQTLKAFQNLQALNLQARCEQIAQDVFVDVGHNVMAAQALLERFKGEKVNLIYNSYLDKDIFEILKTLKPIIDTIQIYKYKSVERKLADDEIYSVASKLEIKCEEFKNLKENKKKLVFGSFMLVENFLKEWSGKK